MFLYALTTMIDQFFFLHTIRSPAFDFNGGDFINESHSYTLMSTILKVDVQSKHLNDRITLPPIQPVH